MSAGLGHKDKTMGNETELTRAETSLKRQVFGRYSVLMGR
jgi:hypothetical protein